MTTTTAAVRRAVLVASLVAVLLALGVDQASAGSVFDAPPAARTAAVTAGGPLALQTTSPSCAIGGIVWEDSSRDRLKTSVETGVAGSKVAFRRGGSTVLSAVTTGFDGRYLFDARSAAATTSASPCPPGTA